MSAAELVAVEDERHRRGPDDEREQHQHGRHEQRDLGARADRDVHGEVHLVLRGHQHGDPVLGGVADDRHHEHADEELGQPDVVRGLLDRADEDLAHHADEHGRDRER